MEAPLRIRAPEIPPPDGRGRRVPSQAADGKTVDSYIQRLIKLIPAEVVTAYLVGREIAGAHDYGPQWAAWCLLATIVFRSIMTYEKPAAKPPRKLPYLEGIEWPAVGIAVVSFSIWVFSLGDSYPALLPSLEQWQATLVLLLWTPFAPLVYKGSRDKKPAEGDAPEPGNVVQRLIGRPSKKGASDDESAPDARDPFAAIRVPAATEPQLAPRLPTAGRRDRIGRSRAR